MWFRRQDMPNRSILMDEYVPQHCISIKEWVKMAKPSNTFDVQECLVILCQVQKKQLVQC